MGSTIFDRISTFLVGFDHLFHLSILFELNFQIFILFFSTRYDFVCQLLSADCSKIVQCYRKSVPMFEWSKCSVFIRFTLSNEFIHFGVIARLFWQILAVDLCYFPLFEDFSQWLKVHLIYDTRVSLLGVDSLWGDCTFILADWGS